MRYRTGKYTVCRRVRVSFSPEILQFEAVNGLMAVGRNENCTVSDFVVVGVAGRGLDADDLGATLLCWQVPQCGPEHVVSLCGPSCSLSSTAW